MDEHLKEARRQLKRLDIWVDELPKWALPLAVAVDEIKMYLESQLPQEAPQASETSSALTPGPVTKRYGSATASLDTSQGQFLLTVETTDSSKSTLFTWEEWAAIRQLCLTPQQIRESLTTSGETKAGDRGPATPEPSLAPSHEAREEMADGSQGCYHEFRLEINGLPDAGGRPLACYKCGQGQYYTFSRRGGAFQSSQEGAQD